MSQQPVSVVRAVAWVLLWQLALSAFLGLVAWVWFGLLVAKSLFSGGLINVIGSAVFALSMLSSRVTTPRAQVKLMFRSELLKLAVVAILFYVAIVVLEVQMLPTIVGFMATVLVFWFALLRTLK